MKRGQIIESADGKLGIVIATPSADQPEHCKVFWFDFGAGNVEFVPTADLKPFNP